MFGKVQLLKVTWLCEHYMTAAAAADFVVVSFFGSYYLSGGAWGPHTYKTHTLTNTPLSLSFAPFVRCVHVPVFLRHTYNSFEIAKFVEELFSSNSSSSRMM